MSMGWTNVKVIRLIEEYQRRPELWDCRHDLFRVQTAKYEAWAALARDFSCDIVDLRMKLNSVFASHRREKARVRAGGRSAWFLYPHLAFLPNHIPNIGVDSPHPRKREKKSVSMEQESRPSSDEGSDRELEHEMAEEIFIKEEPAREYGGKKKERARAGQGRVRGRRRVRSGAGSAARLDGRLLEAVRLLRRAELARKKDACDSFGEYIAASLRRHGPRTQAMIKQAINNILFEQDMKRFGADHCAALASDQENPLVLADRD